MFLEQTIIMCQELMSHFQKQKIDSLVMLASSSNLCICEFSLNFDLKNIFQLKPFFLAIKS